MEAAVVHLPAVSRSRQVGVTEATRTVEMNADTRKLRIGEVAAANAAGATTRETMMAVVVVASSDGMNATWGTAGSTRKLRGRQVWKTVSLMGNARRGTRRWRE